MNVSPAFQAFAQEAPQHQQAWSEAVQALGAASALDDKTAALAYLAVMAAARLDSGLPFHVKMAKMHGATRDEVIAAAKRARCHDFIMELPKGYDTVLEEGGTNLSGGERQRVSIARAIMKDAPIVILDEATSSVDPENEHLLMAAIAELTRGKTLVTIAHRLNTVRDADQIIVVDGGRIVQRGTHEELMAQEGIYRHIFNMQMSSEVTA